MAATTFTKDPDARLDYGRTWAKWLAKIEDVIDESEWIIEPAGELEATDPAHDEAVTKVWLEGGVEGASYKVTNRVTTAGGRVDERSFTVVIRDR